MVEKVIKGLECCLGDTRSVLPNLCTFCPYARNSYATHDCSKRLREDALALLKEQEPRTVSSIIKVHECTLGKCPTCGADLMNYYNEEHCGICGQAVKWDG